MSDGDRPTLFNLPAKMRNDRTAGAEHVTEANHGKDRVARFCGHRLEYQFADALRRTHDIRRPDRLVRADENETLDAAGAGSPRGRERRSEEHTSELQSLMRISYGVFCLIKNNMNNDCVVMDRHREIGREHVRTTFINAHYQCHVCLNPR